MTGFEPRTSGIGSDRSTNWATTTAQRPHHFSLNGRSEYRSPALCVLLMNEPQPINNNSSVQHSVRVSVCSGDELEWFFNGSMNIINIIIRALLLFVLRTIPNAKDGLKLRISVTTTNAQTPNCFSLLSGNVSMWPDVGKNYARTFSKVAQIVATVVWL